MGNSEIKEVIGIKSGRDRWTRWRISSGWGGTSVDGPVGGADEGATDEGSAGVEEEMKD